MNKNLPYYPAVCSRLRLKTSFGLGETFENYVKDEILIILLDPPKKPDDHFIVVT